MKTLLALILLLSALPAQIPGERVYDHASVLNSESIREIKALIAETESNTTAQVAVVTIYSINGEEIDSYANELFNTWGIGQKGVNNGVLFITATGDRRTRIEVGYGLEPLLSDAVCGEILDNYVIPNFKNGDMQAGIVSGTKEILRILNKYPDAAKGIPGSAPNFVLTKSSQARLLAISSILCGLLLFGLSFFFGKGREYSKGILILFSLLILGLFATAVAAFIDLQSTGKSPVGLIGGGFAGLLALFQNFRRYRRFRPHLCQKCGTSMNLLDEKAENSKLSKEEQLEESLGSLDYDVWACPACAEIAIENYKSFTSRYTKCPRCSRHTYKLTSSTVVSATYSSTGLQKFNGVCKNCDYKTEYTRTIPKLTRSRSGSSGRSGGSFGGGSSGGGGSSRSW